MFQTEGSTNLSEPLCFLLLFMNSGTTGNTGDDVQPRYCLIQCHVSVGFWVNADVDKLLPNQWKMVVELTSSNSRQKLQFQFFRSTFHCQIVSPITFFVSYSQVFLAQCDTIEGNIGQEMDKLQSKNLALAE